ncbi:YeeE/YedE family protein [Dyadobacter pollutisoli]|uniref:YeeE/YedE thiosulfate transporter family protein n=1 Tax=Dyadobacter pollutisoli TaxID=2910158 RepID=A0A9E8NCF4_9BACT|nr:YeeE/YedE thiosulfate transporter family protein [Dyadobacter pollutisoli]WAC13448.1 YeeE/YedE thiosulfate transporter family protein [Dyadobacter pollutisoli]
MLEIIKQPWPWYMAGPLIGLTVPALLILGNKSFGISSSLRHVCAICVPGDIPFFQYDWKKELWNMFFVLGIFFGGVVAATFLVNPEPMQLDPTLLKELSVYGITDFSSLVPIDLVSWDKLLTLRGFMMMVGGGFLVGFGARYAGGCTSGHAIMGLSTLQWPSLVATVSFMAGGFVMANWILPFILTL